MMAEKTEWPTMEELENRRKEARDKNYSYSKAQLYDQLHMKPKPDAVYDKSYKGRFGKVYCYNINDCISVERKPPRDKSERTEKQIINDQLLALRAKEKSDRIREAKSVAAALEKKPDTVFLDTETTGLGSGHQIIEMAIIDIEGNTLFDHRFKPTCNISKKAQEVHGISMEDLKDQPQWPDKIEEIRQILDGRCCVIFNSQFDEGMILETNNAFGIQQQNEPTFMNKVIEQDIVKNSWCAMYSAARVFGSTNRYGTISLADACIYADLEWSGDAHCARTDADMTRKLVLHIASYWTAHLQKIEALERKKALL